MSVKNIPQTKKILKDDSFLKETGNALRYQNEKKFEDEVGKKINEIFNEEKVLQKFNFMYGGIHYVSPSLGKWFRFNFGDKSKLDIKDRILEDAIDYAYKKIPKEYNLQTWDELDENILFILSPNNLKKVKRIKDKEFILNKNDILTLLYFISPERTNYFAYVTGEKYSTEKELYDNNNVYKKLKISSLNSMSNNIKELSKTQIFCELETNFKILNGILKDFKDYLSLILKEKENSIKKEIESFSLDRLFRILTFPCIYTLLKIKENIIGSRDYEEEKLYGLIIPFREPYFDILGTRKKYLNYGGFSGIFSKSPSKNKENIKSIIENELINSLVNLEMSVLSHGRGENFVVAEDTIRLCTRINNEKIEDLAKKYSEFFKSVHSKHLGELSSNINPGFDFDKIINEEISPNFIGRNDIFIETLERILVTLKKEYEENFLKILNKNIKKVNGYCSTIFLYGEEGVGKEVMAKICHIVNPRYYISDYIPKVIKFNFDKHYSERGDLDDKETFDEIMKIKNMPTLTDPKNIEKIKDIKIALPKDNPFFNYGNVNMATLDKEAFPKIIFGEKIFFREKDSKSVLGELEIASMVGGTLFLDEIDKLDPKLANQLLKVLERPYTFRRYGEKKDRYSNLLIIFASNKRLEEFPRETFSSAFIYRIGRNYFEIPPLRMRREDIALFIADRISKYNKQNKKLKGNQYIVNAIDLKGLRLLCELPWLNNYRGLNSFIDTLFIEREIRQINSPEIFFDEIIRVIRKLELLKKKSPR